MENTSMINVLQTSMKDNNIVSIYSNKNDSGVCSVGFIEKISDEQVLIKHIHPKGLYDGYAVRCISDIFRIDTKSQYEQRILTLYNAKHQTHDNLINKKIGKEDNLFFEAINAAQESSKVVNISIDATDTQESIIGWIKQVNQLEVIVLQISYYGYDDGETLVKIEDIVKLDCDSQEEKVYEILNKSIK